MKLLIIRLSSMGDVIHTFPAMSDLKKARPDIEVDWLIEPAFSPLAQMHPAVSHVIPFSLRAHKKNGGHFLVL